MVSIFPFDSYVASINPSVSTLTFKKLLESLYRDISRPGDNKLAVIRISIGLAEEDRTVIVDDDLKDG